ncbi:LysE family translocator [Ruegeria sp. HKCCD8929]|uniref:LysE family translocator n=1 Tax=Ruegeria sp. HKCCD8929 TaxID=2683006 RepID=UPI001488B1E0|nr:LysE family translocator [Ruegeria sp. HKCCD8929]
MELGWDFLVFVGALSVAAFLPGPGLAAIVATVLAKGARSTTWFCVGVVLGDIVWLSLSLGGLAIMALQIPAILNVIKWAGVVYLLWLAWSAWNSDVHLRDGEAETEGRSRIVRVLAGFAVTLGNPKAMLFYIALLPSLISPGSLSVGAVVPLYLAVVVILGISFATYSLAAEAARRTMRSTRAVRAVHRTTATALGGAAAWIASR